jgi:hypothetical protein
MKKCPTCEKTFDDSMRFCQSDGTPLVDAAEPVDPYKTMVARPGEISAAIPPSMPAEENPIEEPGREDDVLQLPKQNDPLKTMYASEDEIRREMNAARGDDDQVIEIPPLSGTSAGSPGSTPSAPPSPFGTNEPPPSPFGTNEAPSSPFGSSEPASAPLPDSPPPSGMGIGNMTTPPIPSPFGENTSYEPEPLSESPSFKEPEPEYKPAINPFDRPETSSAPQWSPPPVAPVAFPERGGSGLAPSPAGTVAAGEGQNKTLAIISLVTGILGLTVCCGAVLPSLVALITGFMARGRIKQEPKVFGGSGMATGGIITGAIGLIGGILLLALWFMGAFASLVGGRF